MYVTFKCKNCDTDVNSTMEDCPKCGKSLPEFTLERDYDAELNQEEYELEHPIRTRIRKSFDSYINHLDDVIVEEAELEESATRKVEEIKKEGGQSAARWHKTKRNLGLLAFAVGYIIWVVLAATPIDSIDNQRIAYILWGTLAILPLYGVSVWLLVQNDKRKIPNKQKIKDHSWGAFNKLMFGILYVFLILLIITTINKHLF